MPHDRITARRRVFRGTLQTYLRVTAAACQVWARAWGACQRQCPTAIGTTDRGRVTRSCEDTRAPG